MGKNLHVLIGLTDADNDKLNLKSSRRMNDSGSPLSACSGDSSESDFQVIKRLHSSGGAVRSDGSLIKNFDVIANKLHETSSSDHTIKSNLDALINLIKGFQPILKER